MSLRTSAHTGVAIRNPCLPLGEGGTAKPRRMRAKAPLADQGELSRASPASTRLRGSELSYFDNPSVKNQRFLPAPFTQGSLWMLPHQCVYRCFSKEPINCTNLSAHTGVAMMHSIRHCPKKSSHDAPAANKKRC